MKRGGRWTYTAVCVMMAIGRFEMEFGPEIKVVDGKKPGWLEDNERIDIRWSDGPWFSADESGPVAVKHIHWSGSTGIRLPADHPHYHQSTPTPDERAVAPELVARLVALAKDVALDEIVSRTALRTEARAIIAALEPAVDEDLVEARRLAEWSPYDLTGIDLDRLQETNQQIIHLVLAAIKRGRALASQTASRDVTPCTREQFEEACRV